MATAKSARSTKSDKSDVRARSTRSTKSAKSELSTRSTKSTKSTKSAKSAKSDLSARSTISAKSAKKPKVDSFVTKKRFYDDVNFPFGIDRSGEFTRAQAETLTRYGHAYLELYKGSRKPATKEEKDFLAVFQGKRAAKTVHEITWKAYLIVCDKKSNRPIININANSKVIDDSEDDIVTDVVLVVDDDDDSEDESEFDEEDD